MFFFGLNFRINSQTLASCFPLSFSKVIEIGCYYCFRGIIFRGKELIFLFLVCCRALGKPCSMGFVYFPSLLEGILARWLSVIYMIDTMCCYPNRWGLTLQPLNVFFPFSCNEHMLTLSTFEQLNGSQIEIFIEFFGPHWIQYLDAWCFVCCGAKYFLITGI